MKKYLYSMLAASMLFACSEEELVDITKGEGQQVTFKVAIPAVQSRTVNGIELGAGTQADNLICAMYENGAEQGATPLIKKLVKDSDDGADDGTFTVTVPMAKDIKYDLLFLAYNKDNCAFVIDATTPENTNLKNLEFKADQKANIDAYDAFVGYKEAQGVNDPNTVTLKRPFAQINAATTEADLDNAEILKLNVTQSNLVIENVPKYYNVLGGTASGNIETVTYASQPILKCNEAQTNGQKYPNEMIEVDGENYYYMALAYVLAGETSTTSTHTATFQFQREDNTSVSTLEILSLPIQRNFRTNIIGDLLTKNEEYTISIDAEFGGAHVVDPSVQQPENEEGLRYILEKVSDGDVIKLANDITLTSTLEIPEGLEVTFDLNENTLAGSILAPNADLTIENGTLTNTDPAVSAIEINAGSLNLDNVEITSGRHAVRIDGDVTATINGGTYTVNPASNLTLHALNVSGNANVTINGGTFIGPKGTQADSGSAVCVQAGSTVTINGGNFSGGKNSTLVTKEGANLILNGGAFDQDPTAYVAEGYKALLEDDLYYVVASDVDDVIKTANELVALGGTKINGTYVLAANIDMSDKSMKSMEVSGGANVVFKGNGYTIFNLNLGAAGIHGMTGSGNEVAGLFDLSAPATTVNLTVSDLKIENVKVSCNGFAAAVVGYNSNAGTNITLNNVDVTGAEVTAETVAALVGYTTGAVNLTDCDVANLTLTGEAGRPEKVGALVGTANTASCAVITTNCTNNTTYGDYGRVINGATWNGAKIAQAKDSAELKTALASVAADDNVAITLSAGTYIIPDEAKGKTLTFIGTGNPEDVVIAAQDDGAAEGDCDYSFEGSTVTFEGVTIKTSTTYFPGYVRMKGTYKNCIINGVYTLYDNSTFENCTFNVSGDIYNIWTWGAHNATFTDCTFNTSGKAILLYRGNDTKLTVTNCVFNDVNDNEGVNNKAAIEVASDWTTDKKEIIATSCTVNGFDITDKGINTGSTLWGNKNSLSTDRLSVTIDGVKVY